jgi:hypothetical protein
MSSRPPLVDTYQRYKIGTKAFIQWLATTARATGKVEDVFTTSSAHEQTPTTGGRLKGKARKLAKQERSKPVAKTYEVPLNGFPRLAKSVAAAANVTVPTSMFTILRDIIRARKECVSWFTGKEGEAQKEEKFKTRRHRHFITVLEDVLKELLVKEPARNHQSSTTKAKSANLSNLFNGLEVQDTADSIPVLETDPPHKLADAVPLSTYVLESQTDEREQDAVFAIFCFFKDAIDMRLFVRRTWRDFKRGELTLITAASIMNAAIASIERLDASLIEQHPRFENYHDLIEFIGDKCYNEEDDPALGFLSNTHDGLCLPMSTVMCLHTVSMLSKYLHPNRNPIYDPDTGMRLTQDEVTFVKCLAQLAVLALSRNPDQSGQEDQVVKAVDMYMMGRRTWTILAIQIFWDTLRELQTKVELGWESLQTQVTWVTAAYDEYLVMPDLDGVGRSHQSCRSQMSAYRAFAIELIAEDDVQTSCDSSEFPRSRIGDCNFGSQFLLKHHPARCGLLASKLTQEFQLASIGIAGAQGMITTCAHLYNAARQTDLLPRDIIWADMDHLIEEQGSVWIFVGKRPDHGKEFFSHLHHAFGKGTRVFAKDHNPERAKIDSTRYWTKPGTNRKLRYPARLVETQLNIRSKDGRLMGPSRAWDDFVSLTGEVVARFRCDKGLEKWATHSLTYIEMLKTFKDALRADEFPLAFNYLSLYLRCMCLLRRIQKHCLEEAPFDYAREEYDTNGLDMNNVVSHMMLDLAGTKRVHGSMFPQAVEFMRQVIADEGEKELTRTYSRLAGVKESDRCPMDEEEPLFEDPVEDGVHFEDRMRADEQDARIWDVHTNQEMRLYYRG